MQENFTSSAKRVGNIKEKMTRVVTEANLLPPLSKDTWFEPSTDNSSLSLDDSDLNPTVPIDVPSFSIKLSNGNKLNRYNICRILMGCEFKEPESKKEDGKVARPGIKLPSLQSQTSEEDSNQVKPKTQLTSPIVLNKALPVICRPKKRKIIRVDSNY